jgi:hypothetical protein
MTYCFRYRVRMCTPLQIEADKYATLDIPGLPPVKATAQGDSHGIGTWIIFKGCGFDTEEAAQRVGKEFGDALLVTGAIGMLGIDIGFSRSTPQFSGQIHEAVRRVSGRELRAEMHGLMTFEEDTLSIIGQNAHGSSTVSKDGFQDRFAPWVTSKKALTERQRNCAALLNVSFFVANIEAQFILRVSAVEALCDQSDVGTEYQDVIRSLKDHLAGLLIEASTRATVEQWLENARRQSLRQSYIAKFRRLLFETEAKAFDELYKRRSKQLSLLRAESTEVSFMDHRRGRRHRSDQLQRRGLGDVHALRSARSGRYHPRRMELGARSDVLRHRDRPAQFARDYRSLHPVPAQKDLPSHRPFEQGARRPHTRKVNEEFAEGLLILEYGRNRSLGWLMLMTRASSPDAELKCVTRHDH